MKTDGDNNLGVVSSLLSLFSLFVPLLGLVLLLLFVPSFFVVVVVSSAFGYKAVWPIPVCTTWNISWSSTSSGFRTSVSRKMTFLCIARRINRRAFWKSATDFRPELRDLTRIRYRNPFAETVSS
jgi:hypothetical protein